VAIKLARQKTYEASKKYISIGLKRFQRNLKVLKPLVGKLL